MKKEFINSLKIIDCQKYNKEYCSLLIKNSIIDIWVDVNIIERMWEFNQYIFFNNNKKDQKVKHCHNIINQNEDIEFAIDDLIIEYIENNFKEVM